MADKLVLGIGWKLSQRCIPLLGQLGLSHSGDWVSRVRVPREQDRSVSRFYGHTPEVTQCHFHHTLLTQAVTKCRPGSRGEVIDTTSLWGSSKILEEHVGQEMLCDHLRK